MRSRGRRVAAGLLAGLLAGTMAACSDGGMTAGGDGDGFSVGLLLPSRALPRWEQSDKPLIEKRVKELCPACTLLYANAENDVASQRQQLNSMITKGVEVVLLDAVDTKALRSSVQEAERSGVPVVAYDRLAEGPVSGFVSFDGEEVGRLQGEALLEGMAASPLWAGHRVVLMNGDPAGPNAAWYEKGYRAVLEDRVTVGKSYDTVGWRAENAHDQMAAAIAALGPDGIDGVLAANDTIASGVVSSLKSAGVSPLPPVTGQDADLAAVRRIVRGEQYMTVYKPFRQEADAAASMAVALGRGEGVDGIATTTMDSPTTEDVPAVLLTPTPVTAGTIRQTLVRDGVYTPEEICGPELAPDCVGTGPTTTPGGGR